MLKGIIILFVLLSSCARESESIQAARSLLSESSLVLQSRLPSGAKSVDPEIRSISLVIFPTQKDLETFEYTSSEEVANLWELLGDMLPYSDRLLRDYRVQMDGEKKLEEMVTTVVSIAQLRTSIFRQQTPLQWEAEKRAEEIKAENRALKAELRNISCYYQEEPTEGPYQCSTNQVGQEGWQHKTLSSCRHWENHQFSPEDTPENWEEIGKRCDAWATKKEARREIQDRIEQYSQMRQVGDGLLLDMLLAAERHSGEKVFLPLGASKERPDSEGRPSLLVLDPSTEEIQGLTLVLDFGENYSAGPGFREYSTANGAIVDLLMEKMGWADVMKFTLKTPDFTINASLSLTVQEISGVRFVGEVEVFYPNGVRTTGLMALELDQLTDGE